MAVTNTQLTIHTVIAYAESEWKSPNTTINTMIMIAYAESEWHSPNTTIPVQ